MKFDTNLYVESKKQHILHRSIFDTFTMLFLHENMSRQQDLMCVEFFKSDLDPVSI